MCKCVDGLMYFGQLFVLILSAGGREPCFLPPEQGVVHGSPARGHHWWHTGSHCHHGNWN